MVIVKGAQTHHFTPLLFEAHVLADHISDIIGLLNLKNHAVIEHPCHAK